MSLLRSFISSGQSGHVYPFDFLLHGLDLDNNEVETVIAYKQAVAHLNMIYVARMPRVIMRFPAMVSRRFVALLTAEDPRTLVIVGYFFMLLRKFGGLWWMAGRAAAEFKRLLEIIPTEWQPAMGFAIQLIEEEDSKPSPTFELVDF